jgi:uncharacterized membrane protein (UPF0127 family)
MRDGEMRRRTLKKTAMPGGDVLIEGVRGVRTVECPDEPANPLVGHCGGVVAGGRAATAFDVFENVVIASTLADRFKGMLGAREDDARVMVLLPCHDVHTFGMRCALDIAFVSGDGAVLLSRKNVQPRRRLRDRRALMVLERVHRSEADWFREGETIAFGFVASSGEEVAMGGSIAGGRGASSLPALSVFRSEPDSAIGSGLRASAPCGSSRSVAGSEGAACVVDSTRKGGAE